MMAFCQDVQTYSAAQVFYWIGMNGMNYVLDIFIADTSLMKNRLIWLAITGSPYICNAFAGPEVGQKFMKYSTWRWGYGTFAIITPFMCIPFWAIFYFMNRKAQSMGVIKQPKSGRTIVQSVVHWGIEFDGEFDQHSMLCSRKTNVSSHRVDPHL
jgi:MFS family permease